MATFKKSKRDNIADFAGTFRTPKGEGKWIKTVKPDTKFKEDGEYSVKLVLDPEDPEHVEFMAELDARLDEAVAHLTRNMKPAMAKRITVKKPYLEELDEEKEETGMLEAAFKAYATFPDGKPVKIGHYDGRGKKMTPVLAANGSLVKVHYWIRSYYNAKDKEIGLSLKLKNIQIIELVEVGGDAGFGDEGGFDGSDFDREYTESNYDESGCSDESGEDGDF
ncbi:hypothetical protein [Halodesulfovibrio sp.]|jgi:hypothetical protein|uniref:hypothetical protein n=1 Tax=Halodesulfovibrio sp. TaxID=1912772 RepID=UPI0025E8CA1D|nr:hypothetical protein [Halodesulfovibrio sp.]MCT4535787.1 hypothetical protein [Halodesulfovibrio sp.]